MIRTLKNLFRPSRWSADDDLLGPAKRVMSASMNVDFDFNAYSSKNIFNRLSKGSEYGFYYWPYGYLFRHVRWGGINSLGFRVADNLEDVLIKYNDYYRIAFFGGSTGFDVLVPGNESLVFHLENTLNTRPDFFSGKKVKIFNLSLPGNLVLNQIVNFIQFAWLVKPDLVICHSAANDLCTMQMNDPDLVQKYKIGYPDVLEAWGKKIHNAVRERIDYQFSDSNAENFAPARDRNGPTAVIDAYAHRVRQFNKTVQASDHSVRFLAGFQPWITSKQSLHPEEERARVTYNPYYQKIYQNVEFMYETLADVIVEKIGGDIPLANLHRHFNSLDSRVRHFGDTHHLIDAGNREAAACYAAEILKLP